MMATRKVMLGEEEVKDGWVDTAGDARGRHMSSPMPRRKKRKPKTEGEMMMEG